MKVLKVTEEFVGLLKEQSHSHVVYLNDETPQPFGFCSVSNGHTHEVIYSAGSQGGPQAAPMEAGQAPMPGQQGQSPGPNANPVIPGAQPQAGPQGPGMPPAAPAAPPQPQPAQASWALGPAPDGHIHTQLFDPEVKSKPVGDKSKVVKEVYELSRSAHDLEKESVDIAYECERFYEGEQWEESVRATLESQKRSALTINLVGRDIDWLCGTQRQDRSDIKYAPVEGGDQVTADILNVISKVILDQNCFPREESKSFEDAAVVGRGLLEWYVDFDRNIFGEIKIQHFAGWDDVRIGPHAKEDLSDCEYIVKTKFVSRAQAKTFAPGMEDEIDTAFDYFFAVDDKKENTVYLEDDYTHGDWKPISCIGDWKFVDIARKEIRLIQCERKEYHKSFVALRMEDEFYANTTGWDKEYQAAIKTIPGFTVVPRNIPRFRITKIIGNILIDDENPADVPAFSIVPVYGKKRRNKFWGKVKDARDPQREINKRRSHVVDITNKMAVYGWFYDETTFPDDQEAKKFQNLSSQPGFVIKVRDVERLPAKQEGVKFPGEIVQLLALDMQHMREVMNIVPDQGGANESGVHMMRQEQRKLTGNEFIFDNLWFAKKALGKILVELIQKYYSPERINRILRTQHSRQTVELGGISLEQYSDEDIIRLLETADLTLYDVTLMEQPFTPTSRIAVAMFLQELAKAGQPVPPEVFLEVTPLPQEFKKKIFQAIAQQRDQQAQSTQSQGDGEIVKTLIAQGKIPPGVAQKFGISPQTEASPGTELNFNANEQGILSRQ